MELELHLGMGRMWFTFSWYHPTMLGGICFFRRIKPAFYKQMENNPRSWPLRYFTLFSIMCAHGNPSHGQLLTHPRNTPAFNRLLIANKINNNSILYELQNCKYLRVDVLIITDYYLTSS